MENQIPSERRAAALSSFPDTPPPSQCPGSEVASLLSHQMEAGSGGRPAATYGGFYCVDAKLRRHKATQKSTESLLCLLRPGRSQLN